MRTVRARDLVAGMRIVVDGTTRTIDLVIDDNDDIYVHTTDRLIDYFRPRQLIQVEDD